MRRRGLWLFVALAAGCGLNLVGSAGTSPQDTKPDGASIAEAGGGFDGTLVISDAGVEAASPTDSAQPPPPPVDTGPPPPPPKFNCGDAGVDDCTQCSGAAITCGNKCVTNCSDCGNAKYVCYTCDTSRVHQTCTDLGPLKFCPDPRCGCLLGLEYCPGATQVCALGTACGTCGEGDLESGRCRDGGTCQKEDDTYVCK